MTTVIILLDESYSMSQYSEDYIYSLNKFLYFLKASLNGFVSILKFNDKISILYDNIPSKDLIPLKNRTDFKPLGLTALYNVLYDVSTSIKSANKTFVVVVSDGQNTVGNVSCELAMESIQKCKNTEFIFIGFSDNLISEQEQSYMSYVLKFSQSSDSIDFAFKNAFNIINNYLFSRNEPIYNDCTDEFIKHFEKLRF